MSIVTYSVAPDETNVSTFYNWAHRISAALKTFGWVQSADTGQLVWPSSIVNITNIAGNGTTATYTYTLVQGAVLRIGQSIQITGATTAGFNATVVIASLPLSTTFTALSAQNTTEAETTGRCYGGVNPQQAITDCTGVAGINTYSYTDTDGVLHLGESVVVTGFSTGGFNGTFTVASISGGKFVATTGITNSVETIAATGLVTANACGSSVATATLTATSLPPTAGNYVYEIWKMGDALQTSAPVYFKLQVGNGSASPDILQTVGRATDGAGVISAGATTGAMRFLSTAAGAATQSTTPANCFLSGNTNRFNMLLWPNLLTAARGGFINIERSHDSTGADTADYITVLNIQGSNAAGTAATTQISMTMIAATVAETRPTVIVKLGTGTGSFGLSTILSPVFPVVGAVGNPMLGVVFGKAADWTDVTQFPFTLYNTPRNYLICNNGFVNGAGGLTYETTGTVCFAMRYD